MADSNRRFIRGRKFCLPFLKSPVVVNISDKEGHCCLVGGLSRSITDRALFQTFIRFGYILDAEVVLDKVSGRSRGYGFATFSQRLAMNDAIEEMNGYNLDGGCITVRKAQPQAGSGRDCFECGQPGHLARECPSKGGDRDGSYGGRGNQYGGGYEHGNQ